jgi:hypothetical protein
MSRKLKIWLAAIMLPTLLVAGITGDILWHFLPHTYDPATASTAADVTYYTSIPPPPEAHDFRVAFHSEGIARFVFIRFSAPAEACRKYAQAVLPNIPLKPVGWDQKYNDQMSVYVASQKLNDLRWFDLPYINGHWTTQSGQPIFQKPPDNAPIPDYPDIVGTEAPSNTGYRGEEYTSTEVRVDQSRGIFYLLREN